MVQIEIFFPIQDDLLCSLILIVLLGLLGQLLLDLLGHGLASDSVRILVIIEDLGQKLISGWQEKGWDLLSRILEILGRHCISLALLLAFLGT